MANKKKVIQTNEIERKDYERGLNKFFANYSVNLSQSTGCCLTDVSFVRESLNSGARRLNIQAEARETERS